MPSTLLKLIVWTFICFEFYAQSINYKFQHITSEQGLSANTVLCITQDSKGFLWIGTYDGLNRYDGYNFKVFKHNPDDSTSLIGNSVYAIYEDKSGTLWAGTYGGGLNKFDRGKETFARYTNNPQDPNSISSNDVYAICEDTYGFLWVGTSNGLDRFDKKSSKFFCHHSDPANPNSLSSDIISSLIYDDKSDVLWIGTKSGGLNKYDVKKNLFTSFLHRDGDPKTIGNDFVNCLYRDAAGILWLGTYDGGLNKFDETKNEFVIYKNDPNDSYSISDDLIISIEEDKAGRLLIGTFNGGLNIFDPVSKKFYKYMHDTKNPESVGDNSISAIYKDKNGLIWLGTWVDGLNILNPELTKFVHYKNDPDKLNSLHGNSISAILEDKESCIWVSTDEGGLNKFNPTTKIFTLYKYKPNDVNSVSSDRISSLLEDRNRNIWIGTDGAGICKYDKISDRFIRYQANPNGASNLSVDQISVMLEDKYGELWIGSFGGGGLNKFNPTKNIFTKINYNPDDSVGNTATGIYSLYEDEIGIIWIGTYGSGLFAYDRVSGKSTSYYNIPNDPHSISDNNISVIIESEDESIWVGTYNGLNKLDRNTGKFIRYNVADGLPNSMIYGILEDKNRKLWISTNKGLCKFNYQAGTFRTYTAKDGLQGDEFNQCACFKSKSGKMYFGGLNGFNVFNPDEIKDDTLKAPVKITSLLLFNKPVQVGFDKNLNRTLLNKSLSESDEIELTHDDYVFSLEFAALDFAIPDNIKYAYIMEGFDKDWTYVNADKRFATYTNLDPGVYTFKVKSTNHDGIWNEVGTSLLITINPPWWKTVWAYLGYGIIAIFLLYSLRTYDLKRQRLKQQLELEHEHSEKLEEVDRMKSRFFANISHEFRTPLTLIIGPAEQILAENPPNVLTKNANLIKKNANNMLNLINQLLDLSKLDSGKLQLKASEHNIVPFIKGMVMSFESLAIMNSVKLSYNLPVENLMIYFDREKMEVILKNLLSNAFKFTPNGNEISVSVAATGLNNIEIKVRDTGIGISDEELPKIFDRFYQGNSAHTREFGGTGIGLSLVKELVELHHGNITVDSKIGVYTEFIITLPLGKEHLAANEIVEPAEQPYAENIIVDKNEFVHSINNNVINENLLTNKNIILVVEDNADVREFIKDSLGNEYHFEEAENGEEGIKKADGLIPDLIISDVMMPKMDGNDMTRQLKSDHKTSHIPIILLTAKSGQENRIEGLETGADDYLTKPFDSKELHIRINNLINLRKKLQEIYSIDKIASLPKSKNKLKGIDAQFMDRVLKVIEEHISEEEFSIEEFGNEVGMSRSQMFRKIKALTGKSCSVYLRSVRIAKAKVMLQNNQANVSEIAYSVGFGSPSYFAHCFKEEFGYAPSELVK